MIHCIIESMVRGINKSIYAPDGVSRTTAEAACLFDYPRGVLLFS